VNGTGSARGFTIVELMISMAVMLVVTGAIFRILDPSHAAAQVQPEALDMQQRMRVASDLLFRDLARAGAGPDLTAPTGSLAQVLPSVLPRVLGATAPDAPDAAYGDRITLVTVRQSASQTTINTVLPAPSSPLTVNEPATCPAGRPVCGLAVNDEAVIFDGTGSFDLFSIASVAGSAAGLELLGESMSAVYLPGAVVAKASSRSYYRDASTNTLMVYDNGAGAALPLVDNVVGLAFEYFGDPSPPVHPKPPLGVANCLYDAKGDYSAAGMLTLASDGSLAALPLAMFSDGPWCGGGTNLFDADLMRIRRIRVTIRIQTPLAALRGQNGALFAKPGTSREGLRQLPDLVAAFSVAPRNLNLDR
jgi:prepilin-type N-terminal cleavage/methylation domain-containing protein